MLDPKMFVECLRVLIHEKGFEFPIHFVAVGVNGAIIGGTYTPDEEAECLKAEFTASHTPDGFLEVPVNMMFVDPKGEAARLLFKKPDEWEWSRN